MINLDTIISAFNDKLTLLQWLKKVEKALLEGVLTDASIVDNRDGKFKIKFTFADGTTQETSAIKTFDLETLYAYIEGSESVVVDINESNTALEIHLDAEVMAKIENALQLPKTRPTEQELVGVDETGAQNRLTINELKGLLGVGTKLYKHNLKFDNREFIFTSQRKTQYTSIQEVINDVTNITGSYLVLNSDFLPCLFIVAPSMSGITGYFRFVYFDNEGDKYTTPLAHSGAVTSDIVTEL